MSHEVESMFSAGEVPWHGLGVRVENCLTSREAIVAAGLDWEVEKRQVYCSKHEEVVSPSPVPIPANGTMQEVPDSYAVVRLTDDKPLGVVGARYVPLQNLDAFSFFDELVGNKEAYYETAGSLRGGKVIWIMSKLPGTIGTVEDPIDKWLLLANAHDGSRKVIVVASPVRTVCMNTLNAAFNAAEVSFEMRHTKNLTENIPEVREALGKVTNYFSLLDQALTTMRDVKMTEDQTKLYVHRLFPLKVKMNGDNGNVGDLIQAEIGPRIQKHIDKVMELIEIGKGTDIPGVKGTVYGAFNAAVEWADHYRPVRSDDGVAGRLDSMWFGTTARFKQRAYDIAMEYAQPA